MASSESFKLFNEKLHVMLKEVKNKVIYHSLKIKYGIILFKVNSKEKIKELIDFV